MHTRITTGFALPFALMAAILFGYGVRSDMPQLRWAAIAFLAAAVLLRFFDRARSKR